MMAFASVVEDVIERSGIRDDVKDLLRKQRAREAYEREQAKKQEAENLAMVEQVLGDMKREEADVARVEKELAELERRGALDTPIKRQLMGVEDARDGTNWYDAGFALAHPRPDLR